MKRNTLQALTIILMLTCSGKIFAQSDLLAYNNISTRSSLSDLAELSKDEKVRVSDFTPNPASKVALVNVRCANAISMRVRFFSVTGELAKEETLSLNSGMNELNVDMNDLQGGIYLVQFYSKEGSAVRKIMKMD